MNRLIAIIILSLPFIVNAATTEEKPIYYGPGLCASPLYQCVKVERGQSWESMFPNEDQRDLVQRVNRTYNSLWTGKEIVVPKDLAHLTIFDLSPFPLKIDDEHEKHIVVDQDKLAWGAYDAQGQLVKWGPIASGGDKCSDNSSPTCRTMTGIFRIFSKEDVHCKSNVFPIGKGGAKMPYCMYFHKGLALHGSSDIPGYRASHGCVRMFTQDAKWLNQEWVEPSNEGNNFSGTKVIIRPVTSGGKWLEPNPLGTPSRRSRVSNEQASSNGSWKNPDMFPPTITERKL